MQKCLDFGTQGDKCKERKFGIMGLIGPQENSHYEKLCMWKLHNPTTKTLKQLIYNYPMEIWNFLNF